MTQRKQWTPGLYQKFINLMKFLHFISIQIRADYWRRWRRRRRDLKIYSMIFDDIFIKWNTVWRGPPAITTLFPTN